MFNIQDILRYGHNEYSRVQISIAQLVVLCVQSGRHWLSLGLCSAIRGAYSHLENVSQQHSVSLSNLENRLCALGRASYEFLSRLEVML